MGILSRICCEPLVNFVHKALAKRRVRLLKLSFGVSQFINEYVPWSVIIGLDNFTLDANAIAGAYGSTRIWTVLFSGMRLKPTKNVRI
jgi:hypothetical protein